MPYTSGNFADLMKDHETASFIQVLFLTRGSHVARDCRDEKRLKENKEVMFFCCEFPNIIDIRIRIEYHNHKNLLHHTTVHYRF